MALSKVSVTRSLVPISFSWLLVFSSFSSPQELFVESWLKLTIASFSLQAPIIETKGLSLNIVKLNEIQRDELLSY